jgi:penicillin-binding protein 2
MPRELGYNPAKNSDDKFQRRVVRLALILLLFLTVLALRLFYLQIYQHNYYTAQEARNRSNLLAIEPRRGIIYDRNGIVLANNIAVYSLTIERDRVTHLPQTLNQLQQLLAIDPKDIKIFLKDVKNHPRFAPIPLVNRLSDTQMAKFMLNQYRFPGVSIQTRYLRDYPLGAPLSAVVGYVSRINAKELEQVDPANYSASTNIGKVGIEKYFENKLHGQVGYQRIQMDAAGRKVKELSSIPATAGENLTLTIDSRLQQVAYNALAGERGAVVAIQPQTGQVLALVSSPAYNPNLFVGGIDNKTYQALRNDPAQPLYNRAVRGTFPFGSTIKPFYALQGLETGTITPNFTIFDPGYFLLPGVRHVYHNWTWNVKHRGQGTVNVTSALEQSNDTFFFTLSIKMGIEKMAAILNEFGFGTKTGIEISEEATGHIGTPEWKRAKKHQAWYAGDTLAAGIGQGYMTTTAMQLAEGISTLANRGQHLQPTLLLQTQSANDKTTVNPIKPLPPIKLQKSTWDIVLNGLTRVISVGTGSYHFGQSQFGKPQYQAAGKTGTAQVAALNNKKYNKNGDYNLRDNSLLEVFAPADNPQIAVAVIVEHNETAGLVARQVVDYYLLNILKINKPLTVAVEKVNPTSAETAAEDNNTDKTLAVDDDEVEASTSNGATDDSEE